MSEQEPWFAPLREADALCPVFPNADRDEMICDRCGRRHDVVWFAPSDVWNQVMRGGDRGKPDEYGFCCPICFIQLAEKRGVETAGWLVTPFSDGPVRYASQIVLRAATSQASLDE